MDFFRMGDSEVAPFIAFLASMNREERGRLISDPSFCLFLFRLFSPSTQSLILSLIWDSTQLIRIDERIEPDISCVTLLEQLDIVLQNGVNNTKILNPIFRRGYLSGALEGSHRSSRFVPINSEKDIDKKKKKDKDVVKKSNERWECLLRFLALPSESTVQNVSSTTRDVLNHAGFTSGHGTDIEITSKGFQFLLLSPVKQIWSYMIELLKMETREGRSVKELLDVLLRMALCIHSEPENKKYEVDNSWTERQCNFVTHLRELGLIFIRKRKDGFFYLTPNLANLCLANHDDSLTKKSGSIIVETNFRVYAYTSSSLQLAILSSFTCMTYRFHDMSVGILTRDSVRKALQVGITANQIISFLKTNCHPESLSTSLPIPITVSDQIRLWEDERKRLIYQEAALYSSFESEKVSWIKYICII
ncbi:hypothetical protein PRIPAC_81061 [Pristionchus pacificus]|uniref:General transcription factor IIH subunit 4 n=1 Tax=Pristionchus pacificus TaxID=54126 RepID=A0A8R1V3A6_PRIPA|nr:hypothetical protein PRIPAC_81061 [Pristionchus pacificus]